MATAQPLQRELETFEKLKAELVPAQEGKYALIQGDTLHGTWDTYEDALSAGYAKFGIDTPFLVKKISGIESVHCFTRDLATCQS